MVNAGLGGEVQVVAYDATKDAIELMGRGEVSMALAQKPFGRRHMAVQFAAAHAAGVTRLPKRVETGFAITDKNSLRSAPIPGRFLLTNVTGPEYSLWAQIRHPYSPLALDDKERFLRRLGFGRGFSWAL